MRRTKMKNKFCIVVECKKKRWIIVNWQKLSIPSIANILFCTLAYTRKKKTTTKLKNKKKEDKKTRRKVTLFAPAVRLSERIYPKGDAGITTGIRMDEIHEEIKHILRLG